MAAGTVLLLQYVVGTYRTSRETTFSPLSLQQYRYSGPRAIITGLWYRRISVYAVLRSSTVKSVGRTARRRRILRPPARREFASVFSFSLSLSLSFSLFLSLSLSVYNDTCVCTVGGPALFGSLEMRD